MLKAISSDNDIDLSTSSLECSLCRLRQNSLSGLLVILFEEIVFTTIAVSVFLDPLLLKRFTEIRFAHIMEDKCFPLFFFCWSLAACVTSSYKCLSLAVFFNSSRFLR